MSKSNDVKRVYVKEDPKTSLVEAGIFPLELKDGMKVVAIGHTFFPDHDRAMYAQVLNYLEATRPDVVILLGGMLNEEAFRDLSKDKRNILHCHKDQPEVAAAKLAGTFEHQVMALGRSCGDFIKSFGEAGDCKVIFIPSATHLSMPNEVRLMEFIGFEKDKLDRMTAKLGEDDASDAPSELDYELSDQLAVILGLDRDGLVEVLPYGAGVLVNDHTMFMIGDFRRRHAGDASFVEWEQRGYNIVRGFDGKLSSGWMTTSEHTLPLLVQNFHDFHEVGYMWDAIRMGHTRDYDRRAPGFYVAEVDGGQLFGYTVPIVPGNDGRRSFVIDGVAYTEDTPGCKPNGRKLSLAPRRKSALTACEQKSEDCGDAPKKSTRKKKTTTSKKKS